MPVRCIEHSLRIWCVRLAGISNHSGSLGMYRNVHCNEITSGDSDERRQAREEATGFAVLGPVRWKPVLIL